MASFFCFPLARQMGKKAKIFNLSPFLRTEKCMALSFLLSHIRTLAHSFTLFLKLFSVWNFCSYAITYFVSIYLLFVHFIFYVHIKWTDQQQQHRKRQLQQQWRRKDPMRKSKRTSTHALAHAPAQNTFISSKIVYVHWIFVIFSFCVRKHQHFFFRSPICPFVNCKNMATGQDLRLHHWSHFEIFLYDIDLSKKIPVLLWRSLSACLCVGVNLFLLPMTMCFNKISTQCDKQREHDLNI